MVAEQALSSFLDNLSQRIQQYAGLKDALTDFVLDAEGDLATALETFSAEQLSRWSKPSLSGLNRSELAIDMFLCEGQSGGASVIDLFIQSNLDLKAETQDWIQQWKDSFQGLFVIDSVSRSEHTGQQSLYTLTNWLTQKHYNVWSNPLQGNETLSRMKPGEIVLARLLPLGKRQDFLEEKRSQEETHHQAWTFSGPLTLLGKLGKPKLAIAIGNFKQWFPLHLYGDAPDLKEAAWASVQQHYDEFVDFFGAEKITLSGYDLSKKMQAYQAQVTERQLAEAGIDSSKSLKEMAKESGLSDDEVAEAVESLGAESKAAKALIDKTQSLKMVMPKVTLPDELRRAEAVTVLVHPRWGQAFLSDYQRLETLLTEASSGSRSSAPSGADQVNANQDNAAVNDGASQCASLDRLVLSYLENEQATPYVWQTLVQDHSTGMEAALRRVLNQPEFTLSKDLESLLHRYGKPLTPNLPETASVPLHLHTLFQEALRAVSKADTQKKKKKKSSKKSGFGR